jgi:Transposase DDE domain group 1
MTPPKTECTAKSYAFGSLSGRQVVADFSGGQLTTDGGVILIAQVDAHYRLSERLASCFSDSREASRVQHEVKDLVAQRLYGLVQGYEDLNDHDLLRHDPMFGLAVGKLENHHARCAPLAGKSTLNRLEQAMHVPQTLTDERYVKVSLNPQAIADLLVSVSLEQVTSPPKSITLDMDVTNDELYGNQASGFFNGYYDQVCYAPLLIFWGHRLLSAKLRPSNVDPAAGALDELQRLIPLIRQRWPQVPIIVRGDSAYGRDDIMAWCEAQSQVDYVLAHASNPRLRKFTSHLEARAKAAYEQQRQDVADTLASLLGDAQDLERQLDTLVPPQIWYQSLPYRTEESWSCERRVVCKLTYDASGARRHFVVTSFDANQVATSSLHRDYYCPRGDMENRIKEHQLDLFSDRTSTHDFESNQLRVWFSSFAYVLMQALRYHGLDQTEWAQAQCGTIRLKLLKVAAQIRVSVRRVLIAFSSAWPGQAIFTQVYHRLQQLPRPG